MNKEQRVVDNVETLEVMLRSEDELDPGEAQELKTLATSLPIRDVVAIVERCNPVRAALVLRLLPRRKAIEVFDAMDFVQQADVIDELGNAEVFEYFDALEPEDRVALLDELPVEIADRLLRSLNKPDRDITGVVLGYEKGSVGRRMSPEVPTLYPEMTAAAALAQLKETAQDLETIYTLPIVETDRRLVGVVSFREVFQAAGDTPLGELMHEAVQATATDDAEEVVRWFLPLGLLALPIVDASGRLV